MTNVVSSFTAFVILVCVAPLSAQDPAYARFAKGTWKPAFTAEDALKSGTNAARKDGVITVNDGFVRDASADAISAKDVIARVKIRGRGGIFVRGGAGIYVAWLGEKYIGVNKHVDAKTTVLSARPAPNDPQTFHELALAAVGDRILVFLDGKRMLDVADTAVAGAAAVAVNAHLTKADFKEVEVMSLDGLDVARLLPERDPLAKYVGTWDVERTLTVAGLPPQKSKGVMHMAPSSLGGFYLVRSSADDGSSSLFVQQYLPEESAIRTWIFLSNGTMDRYDKQLNPDTDEQFIPARTRQGVTESGSIRKLDATTGETRFKRVDADGKLLSEFVSINKRREQPSPPPDLRSAEPAKDAPEIGVLAPYIGKWDMEMQLQPTKFEAQAKTDSGLSENDWFLGGRYLLRLDRKSDGELANLQVAGYDREAKAIVFTMFQSGGSVVRWTTTADAGGKEFQINMIELSPGWKGSARDRVLDAKTIETKGLLKDADGGVIWDATVTRKRKS